MHEEMFWMVVFLIGVLLIWKNNQDNNGKGNLIS
jgi:hypothetical protein